ncbi:f23138e2-0e52-4424-aeb6-c83788e8cbc3 [Thermothielavioides terrestris]|uniref:F23138e2-0e52-4424-aeb6-c83788e8cbc3 n=1 Tax=Thermothielavioides terrestris TaxID=2587410 RepID=A0A3S4C655_9PEZI|nr:f23138e2-0e52-4424-aeb6-c83788e8cbc3 [Thermothielavioides terrestris]
MSKPVLSFGLKKAGPSKPAPALQKRAPFGGGGDDDGSGDEAAPNNVAQVSELDLLGSTPSTNPSDPLESRKKPSNKKHLHPNDSPPSQPPRPPAPPKPDQFTDLSSALTSRKHASSAEAADPSIYDYDAAYDSFKAAKQAAQKAASGGDDDAQSKRPRYFSALQQAADVRARDRQLAEERRLARERAAEGDAFAGKEQFATEAYQRQLAENRRLRAEEEAREAGERERNKGRGLAVFYQDMLERGEREHAALVKAAEEGVGARAGPGGGDGEGEVEEDREKSAAERAREINAMGGNVLINEDGEVVDKRQLLKGGLNVAAKKKAEVQQERARQEAAAAAAARTGAGAQSKGAYAAGGKRAMRERQSRMLEAQLEESLKRSRQEEEEEAAKIALASKSRKTAADFSSAKERYLARKRAAEEAKKNGETEGS